MRGRMHGDAAEQDEVQVESGCASAEALVGGVLGGEDVVMVGAVAVVGRGLNGSCFAFVQFDVGYNYRGYAVWSRESCSVLAPAAESLALVLPQRRLFAKTCTSSQSLLYARCCRDCARCAIIASLSGMMGLGIDISSKAQQVYTPSSIMGDGFF